MPNNDLFSQETLLELMHIFDDDLGDSWELIQSNGESLLAINSVTTLRIPNDLAESLRSTAAEGASTSDGIEYRGSLNPGKSRSLGCTWTEYRIRALADRLSNTTSREEFRKIVAEIRELGFMRKALYCGKLVS